jgi:hypothetical protein
MSGSEEQQYGTVNPDLAALMRVIEDNQSKMPEGEYLVAMNALGALHRVEEENKIRGGAAAAVARRQPPPSYRESVHLFAEQPQRNVGEVDYQAWLRVTRELPAYSGVTLDQWMSFQEQDRIQLLREATEKIAATFEIQHRNPNPTVCSFISRHSVGPWRFGTDDASWTCVCGYSGKSKHWKKHEDSERHRTWAVNRIVPPRTHAKMKGTIQDDCVGHLVRLHPTCANRRGVRCFLAHQDENEWTSPELFPYAVRKAREDDGTWDVIVKEHRTRQYEM